MRPLRGRFPSPYPLPPYMDASGSASVGVVMVQSGACSLTSGLFVQALGLLAMVAFAGAVPICMAGLMLTGESGVSAPRLCLLVPSRCFFHALLETVFCKRLSGLSGGVCLVVFKCAVRRSGSSSRAFARVPFVCRKWLAAREHRPNGACEFARQRRNSHVARAPLHEFCQPAAALGVLRQ